MNQLIGFKTLLNREVYRFVNLINQTVFPPIISSLLYILIFGYSLGSRIKEIDGFPYVYYILPGLAMMGTITSAYSNTSTSLYVARLEKSIEDILISPLSYLETALAFVLGGMIRGVLVGSLILATFLVVGQVRLENPFYVVAFILLVSLIFSCCGIISALKAERMDHIMLFSNFFINPLVFLGGVFYSVKMLPGIWHYVSLFNPILYMVNGLRYGVLGVSDVNPLFSLGMAVVVAASLFSFTVYLFKTGYKLRL
ncbi:MAG: ABC transporter permease [Thermodesulfobacteriota bacterium]